MNRWNYAVVFAVTINILFCRTVQVWAQAYRVDAYKPLKTPYDGPGPEKVFNRWIEFWNYKSSKWCAGILSDRPYTGSHLPRRGNYPYGIPRAVVAVNLKNGTAKWLHGFNAPAKVQSVFRIDDQRCAVVIDLNAPDELAEVYKTQTPELVLVEWNLETDELSPPQAWIPINPVAREIDLSEITLDWTPKAAWTSEDGRLTIQGKKTEKTVAIPPPYQDYEHIGQMSVLWEGGKPTRWYAPIENRRGIILFEGLRINPRDVSGPYDLDSTLTCFDPSVKGGIRWKKTLSELTEELDGAINHVIPVFSMSQTPRELLVEIQARWVIKRENERGSDLKYRLLVKRIDLKDGSVSLAGELTSPRLRGEYGKKHVRSGWAYRSPDSQLLVFECRGNPYTGSRPLFEAYRIYKSKIVGERLEIPINTEIYRRGFKMITITNANEAIIDHSGRVLAIPLTEGPDVKPRLIFNLFDKLPDEED